jgi:hypothetical protein
MSTVAMMRETEQVHFVLGGKILDRTMPKILKDQTPSLIHRNRFVLQDQWDTFCDDIEAAMSWKRHWYSCFKSLPVQISLSLTITSLLVLLWTNVLEIRRKEEHQSHPSSSSAQEEMNDVNVNVNTTILIDNLNSSTSSTGLFLRMLPDICVFLAVITLVAMTFSMILVADTLQHHVAQVCHDYTQQYQSYYGIRFAVKRHLVLVTTTRRTTSHSHHHRGASAALLHRTKAMPYIEITKEPPDEVSTTVRTAESYYQSIEAAPFFDFGKTLLPPRNNAFPVRVPKTWKEEDEDQATTSAIS